jgi:hypothetical protein
MNDLIPHFIEGVLLLGLGVWNRRLEVRSTKTAQLEIDLAVLKTRVEAHSNGIERLQEGLDDVREHMARREDIEALRRALGS